MFWWILLGIFGTGGLLLILIAEVYWHFYYKRLYEEFMEYYEDEDL